MVLKPSCCTLMLSLLGRSVDVFCSAFSWLLLPVCPSLRLCMSLSLHSRTLPLFTASLLCWRMTRSWLQRTVKGPESSLQVGHTVDDINPALPRIRNMPSFP